MSHKKKTQASPARRNAAQRTTPAAPARAKRQPIASDSRVARWLPYGLAFLLFWFFCAVVYGDVFTRAAEANFVTSDAMQMKYVLDQRFGWLYWPARYVLLTFSQAWLGGLVMSLLLTAAVALADYALRLPASWRGASALLPGALLGWMLWRGTSLYYKNEPSLIFVLPFVLLAVLALAAVLVRFLKRRRAARPARRWRPYGLLVPVVVFAALWYATDSCNQNVVLTARMQNRLLQADWDGMIEDALSARRPTRAVAAYYAVALVQEGQLLERIFDIPFDYPDARLDHKEGSEEYGIFQADCDFYSGLFNPAYRCALEHIVMNGPNLYYLKRLAVCAIMNGETALADKYLDIIDNMPFNGKFVAKYRPMLADSTLIEQDAELARVMKFKPQEAKFEQNYRAPIFLGYNLAMLSGTDESLELAIAANLYSKTLPAALNYILVYYQKHQRTLPPVLQQAVVLAANDTPAVMQYFPGIVEQAEPLMYSFYTIVKPIIEERDRAMAGKSQQEQEAIRHEYNARMRKDLKADWLGTYYYYYFCENVDQNQEKPHKTSGVN